MRILFDVVHPADVHFFRHTIGALLEAGASVLVTSRHKDVTVELLDAFRIPHRPISRLGSGRVGLFTELLLRDASLLAAARAFRPDLLVANNSPCAAHVAWLTRRPSLVFEDTEIHRHSHRLYLPFVTEVHTPASYGLSFGRKHRRYPGYHSLAYLSPRRFEPSAEVLRRAGIDPNEKIVLLRLVGRGAMHDQGARWLSAAGQRRLIEGLRMHARVLLSAEGDPPSDLRDLQPQLPVTEIHHLIHFAALMVGESATMCSEAAVLGTPAILVDSVGRGYTDDLERTYGLCTRLSPLDEDLVVETATAQAIHPPDVGDGRARMLEDLVDVVAYQLEQIQRLTEASV